MEPSWNQPSSSHSDNSSEDEQRENRRLLDPNNNNNKPTKKRSKTVRLRELPKQAGNGCLIDTIQQTIVRFYNPIPLVCIFILITFYIIVVIFIN